MVSVFMEMHYLPVVWSFILAYLFLIFLLVFFVYFSCQLFFFKEEGDYWAFAFDLILIY